MGMNEEIKESRELRDQLKFIDKNEDIEVSRFEANFLENVLYRYRGPLSSRQKEIARQILEKYGDK